MSQLPVREQFIVHALKSFTDGEIQDPVVESQVSAGRAVETTVTPPLVYTDPEDIPFGQPKKTYALAWTKDKIRPFKTKAGKKKPWESAEPKLRVWKRWYERQGWTIFGAATGGWHIARSPQGELHAAIIREYDAERKKRL